MTMLSGPYFYTRGPSDDELLDDLVEAVSLTGEILGQIDDLESAGVPVETEYPGLLEDVFEMSQQLTDVVQELADE